MKILNFKKNVTEIVILSSLVILLTTVSCTIQNELAPGILTFGDIEKVYYDEDQINNGFFPMCVAYASSDVSMLISQEQYLN